MVAQAVAFGEHLAGERDCLGYQVETLPAFARTRIPVLNPCHFFNEAHYRTLAAWWNLARREPIYVSGPSGSGKTSTAMQFCARLGIPVVKMCIRDSAYGWCQQFAPELVASLGA